MKRLLTEHFPGNATHRFGVSNPPSDGTPVVFWIGRAMSKPEIIPANPNNQHLADKLNRHIDHVNERGCWIWDGTIKSGDYGKIRLTKNGLLRRAHAVAYSIVKDVDIPNGICACHKCDDRRCINPDHIFLGTRADNVADMFRKKRDASFGSRNPKSKLKEEDIPIILGRIANGEVQNRIAEDYGVNSSVITSIKHNRAWMRVERGHYARIFRP